MAQPRPVGHISSDRLLSRQAETYEAKIQAMGELLESEKRLALETQVGRARAPTVGGFGGSVGWSAGRLTTAAPQPTRRPVAPPENAEP
jgi:hypothetical protein